MDNAQHDAAAVENLDEIKQGLLAVERAFVELGNALLAFFRRNESA